MKRELILGARIMKDAKGQKLDVGDVVQCDPNSQRDGFFAGCFMVVIEVTVSGVVGLVAIPGERGTSPGHAYFRAKGKEVVRIGHAEWAPAR